MIDRFSGLTDQAENDIYEGDIYLDEHKEALYEIVFHKEYYGFFSITKNENASYDNKFFPLYDILITIIGNIHENPNLLK